MDKRRVLVLIPARYASSRFPGKPLASIAGKSMIQRVFQNCCEAEASNASPTLKIEACVVTDDERIESHVKTFGGQVVRVDDDVSTGSERIWLAYERNFQNSPPDLIINVQGDEPLLKYSDLVELAEFHLSSSYDIATMVALRNDLEGFENKNCVKAVFSQTSNQCLYFSRAQVPCDRDGNFDCEWFLHVGVYSYRPEALKKFTASGQSYYEQREKLEQLRALESGLTIGAIETKRKLIGVDTPEDLEKLEGVLSDD